MLALVALSASYFIFGKNEILVKRLIKSGFGFLFVMAFIYAALIQEHTYLGYSGWLLLPFYGFLLLGAISLITSFWRFSFKQSYFHIAHAVTFYAGLHVVILGALVITHDSL